MKTSTLNLMNFAEILPHAMIVVDKNQTIQFANQYARTLFGYSQDLLITKNITLLISQNEQKKFSQYYAHHSNKSKTKSKKTCQQFTGIKHNKRQFPMEVHLSLWRDNHESLTFISIRDLTYENELHQKKEALEYASETKDQFLTTMNHQLRTPLNAILGFSELLLLKLVGELTPEQEKQITIIHKSGKYLLSLIQDLSDLAKINSGEVSVLIEEINGQELIQDIMNTVRPMAIEKQLTFSAMLPSDAITFKSDKRLLTQVITNIVNNAIKFTDKGQVTIELTKSLNTTTIHVTDTGIGIKKEKVEYLFNAFQQLFIGEKKSEGSGLGLHISKKLADLMRIKLNVDSQYGEGTHFSIVIPHKP